ncbi:hypothetical protein MRS44_002864 [Fusarium solani]|uniref:uncharacterized protein n=1 Tax=Fusarium solani TaxID=169388 RepID=UPI0032C43D81|nr:hypothetical protein MRS44_002864 [Fusarium solani]
MSFAPASHLVPGTPPLLNGRELSHSSFSAPEAGDLQHFAAPGLRLWDRKPFQLELYEREEKKNVESLAGILALETHKFPSVQVFVKLVRFSFNSSPRPQPPPRPVISSTPSQIPPERGPVLARSAEAKARNGDSSFFFGHLVCRNPAQVLEHLPTRGRRRPDGSYVSSPVTPPALQFLPSCPAALLGGVLAKALMCVPESVKVMAPHPLLRPFREVRDVPVRFFLGPPTSIASSGNAAEENLCRAVHHSWPFVLKNQWP